MIPALVGASLGSGTPPSNYYSIQTYTVGAGGSASITFSSIDQSFTHLQIRAISRCSGAFAAGTSVKVEFNSDSTATNYYSHYILGNGSGTPTAGASNSAIYASYGLDNNLTASVYSAHIIDILDYTNTNKYKTLRNFSGYDTNGGGTSFFSSSLWKNSSAISTITITASDGNWVQYSSFALYGVK